MACPCAVRPPGALAADGGRTAAERLHTADGPPRARSIHRRHRQQGGAQPAERGLSAPTEPRLGHRRQPAALRRPAAHLGQGLLAAGHSPRGAVSVRARLQREPAARHLQGPHQVHRP